MVLRSQAGLSARSCFRPERNPSFPYFIKLLELPAHLGKNLELFYPVLIRGF